MRHEPAGERLALIEELRRRFILGDVVIGQVLEVGDEQFRIEGFDSVGANARHVYLRTEHGEHLSVKIENA